LPASISVIFIKARFTEAFDDAATAFPDKGNDLVAFVAGGEFLFQVFERLAGIHPFIVDDAVDIEDMIDLVDGETAALEAHGVDAGIAQRHTGRLDIGRNVLADQRTATQENMGTHPNELVDGTHSAEDDPVAQHYVSCHLGVIAEDTIVADDTVVGDMAVGQDHTITAHFGLPPVAGTA